MSIFEDGLVVVKFLARFIHYILVALFVPVLMFLAILFTDSIRYAMLFSVIIIYLGLLFLKFFPNRDDETDSVNINKKKKENNNSN